MQTATWDILGDENVLKLDCGDGCTTLTLLKITELYK